jgi:hypothetical protein
MVLTSGKRYRYQHRIEQTQYGKKSHDLLCVPYGPESFRGQGRRLTAAGWFDSVPGVKHPRAVMRLVRRLAALAVTLGLMAGNAAVCAGWLPTAEARMACCADGTECPMHKGDSHRSGSARVLTQAQADSCCAPSERENSKQSNPSFVAAITASVLGAGTVLPANVPPLVLSDGWRTSGPMPVAPVPKHVLLSVFLV